MTWCHSLGLLDLEVLLSAEDIGCLCSALVLGRFDLIWSWESPNQGSGSVMTARSDRAALLPLPFLKHDRCLWGPARDESDSSNAWERHLELVYEKSSISEPEHSVLLTRANTSCVTSVNDTLSILRRERIHHPGTTFNGVLVNRDSIVPPLAFQVS
jgi:hypothetical protein